MSLTGAPIAAADIIEDVSALHESCITGQIVYPNPFNDHLYIENTRDISGIVLVDITGWPSFGIYLTLNGLWLSLWQKQYKY